MGKLTDIVIRNAKVGRHQDGQGLFLEVRSTGAKFWLLRVMKYGKRSEMGLGSYPGVSLAAARIKAGALRISVKEGRDVLADKREAEAARREAADRTFEVVARKLHEQRASRATKTNALVISRVERFVFPTLGKMPVDKVTGPMVISVLEPIWTEKPETARRVRRAISSVLKYAHSRQWFGPVPILSDLTKDAFPAHTAGVRHHPAVQHPDAPTVLAQLQSKAQTVGRLALQFTVFTCLRSKEIREAVWGEVDFAKAEWSIPAIRMKKKRDHVVPLTAPALAILETMAKAYRLTHLEGAPVPADGLIFPGARAGRPMSDMTMSKVQKLVAPDTTVHGWRSTFRDWAGETTDYSSDLCEAAIAHLIGNSTMRAYQRGTMLEKRRALMNDWAGYLIPS